MIVGDLLTRNARKFPANIAIRQDGISVTYEALNDRVNALADSLLHQGLMPGDRVGVLLPNTRHFIEIYFAAAKTGAIFCPFNPMFKEKELIDVIEYTTPRFLFFGKSSTDLIDSVGDRVGARVCLICLGKPVLRKARKVPFLDYEEFLAHGSASEPRVNVKDDDTMSIFLTSGPTGQPMGAMRTHRHIITAAYSTVLEEKIYYDERILMTTPFYHVSFEGNLGRSFLFPNTTVIGGEQFDPESTLGLLSRECVTVATFIPIMINALIRCLDISKFDLARLRLIIYAGGPMPLELLRTAIQVFHPLGVRFLQHYGLTESGPSMTVLPPEDHITDGSDDHTPRLASAGRPVLDCEIRIVDERGRDVAPGKVGEIIGRSETIMKGYWNLPRMTADKIKGGWLYTGDLGKFDKDGYLYLVNRKGDMIIRGGKNIYPREIEEILYTFPGIIEATVIGVPDDLWGESVKALVVMREGITISKADIINFCGNRLADYKKPQSIEFLKELPKSAHGKILRRALREKYWKGSGRTL